ncbi:hypothetical protein BJ741DRAFT_680395 [Chytriomyces cf. hyalinus JEL632]|nr:hypothetical protein BJ741DRAFT_680395 [Chytriomyces cf. hyalinus JEL632]
MDTDKKSADQLHYNPMGYLEANPPQTGSINPSFFRLLVPAFIWRCFVLTKEILDVFSQIKVANRWILHPNVLKLKKSHMEILSSFLLNFGWTSGFSDSHTVFDAAVAQSGNEGPNQDAPELDSDDFVNEISLGLVSSKLQEIKLQGGASISEPSRLVAPKQVEDGLGALGGPDGTDCAAYPGLDLNRPSWVISHRSASQSKQIFTNKVESTEIFRFRIYQGSKKWDSHAVEHPSTSYFDKVRPNSNNEIAV